MTVTAFTLGCKVNQYDTEMILHGFSDRGYMVCDTGPADIYIINTCTVTNISDKKSRKMISRAYRENPDAFIVAYGCYAQVKPEVLRDLPGVSMVIGTDDKHRVAEIVTSAHSGVKETIGKIQNNRYQSPKRNKAYLKVQDGCDRFCSYCIVPYARGGVVKKPAKEAVAEAKRLVADGYREIVITGIQIASYGDDLKRLIKQVHDIPGLERIHLSSLEPNIIDDDFLRALSALPKLCGHFHLSLQSGCDRVLARMNRRYTTADYANAVASLRGYFPDAELTTDIIAGFPGETEEDFIETVKFVESIGFSGLHVFPYSPKEGTPAAGFSGQVDAHEKERRSKVLRQLVSGSETVENNKEDIDER